MRLPQTIAWGGKNTAWVWGWIFVLVIGVPLVVWSAAQARAQASQAGGSDPPSGETVALAAPRSTEISLAASISSEQAVGRARLDLTALAQAHSIDESDNVRWALVRRTPQATQVYRSETGVDWTALRGISGTGTILVLAGFPWSFNETFQDGPGYKEASGVLAGGHCALATTFRAVAVQAGLPAASRRHATPIPGFSLEESVNILWGRDDLVVHNNTDQDLYFVWAVEADQVNVALVPVVDALPLPPLPDWSEGTVAMVYGRPGPGGWGSLGQSSAVDHATHLARTLAARVDEWNGDDPVAVAVNPNVVMAGKTTERDLYVYHLIAEARRQGYYVMLDVQPGDAEPLALFEELMDQFLGDNVWFDWDIEHTAGGRVDAAQINRVANAFFARRQVRGYQTPAVFGFYVFKENQVSNPSDVQLQYEGGVVAPIFDGYGGRSSNPESDKIAKTTRVLSLFGQGPFGIMEFETRWGTRYDRISAQAYFEAFPETLIFASQ